ncbi:MAG: hypothetical protein RLZ04_1436 [Actinomycetota bacterium]
MSAVTLADEVPTRFRWDRLTWSSALGYCLLVCGLSVGVVLGELRDEFGISGVIAALHGSTFGVGLIVAGLLGVRLVDLVGRRTALMTSAAMLAGGVAMFCLGPVWPVTLAGTAFSGLGGAFLVMVMPSLISDHHGEHRAEAFAAVNGAPGMAGLLFSLVIGASLSAGWSWRPPYLVLTGLAGLGLAVVALPVPVPEARRDARFSLRPMTQGWVLVPWLHMVTAVVAEFSLGIWAVTYLAEVGGASPGAAAILASGFGIGMFTIRIAIPHVLRIVGDAAVSLSFVVFGFGTLLMCFGPSLWVKVVGVALGGFAGGPLYPLTVDRFYARTHHRLDSVTLGAYCSLASGAAVTFGPLVMGMIADLVSLRWAILMSTFFAVVGAITQRPRDSRE